MPFFCTTKCTLRRESCSYYHLEKRLPFYLCGFSPLLQYETAERPRYLKSSVEACKPLINTDLISGGMK